MPLDGMDGYLLPYGQADQPVSRSGVPYVRLGRKREGENCSHVLFPFEQVGRMGAELFLKKGLGSLAFYLSNPGPDAGGRERLKGFRDACEQAGVGVAKFALTSPRKDGIIEYDVLVPQLSDWLRGLPHPLGLMVSVELHGQVCLDACHAAGLRVPEDVAICCGGDDEIRLASTRPSITAIRFDTYTMGYEAGRLLRQVMEKKGCETVTVPPLGLVERGSTALVWAGDSEVSAAMKYIWKNIEKQLTVEDVLENVPVSRSTLERKFREHLDRTPAQEIQRSRLETARRLLASTRMSLASVAIAAGYPGQSPMGRAIKTATGLTPRAYRQQFRTGKAG